MWQKQITSHFAKAKGTGALLILLTGLLFLLILLSASCGYIKIPFITTLKIIYGKLFHKKEILKGINRTFISVIWDVRLPRIMSAVFIGMSLSVAGVIFQGVLLNPLADPYTLGVSAGAAFGASIALVLGIFGLSYSVPIFAFCGAISTLAFVIFLSLSDSSITSTNLILSGVIITAILSAGISFIKFLADEHVSVIIFWLMGSLASKTWKDVLLVFTFFLFGFFISYTFSKELNLLALGDKIASSLGVNTNFLRILLLTTASLMTSICVSISGIIGFIGLIVPHFMRFITGADNTRLMPASAISGGILLLGADTLSRTVLPVELPIGVLTALIGGPIFCIIFKKRQKSLYQSE